MKGAQTAKVIDQRTVGRQRRKPPLAFARVRKTGRRTKGGVHIKAPSERSSGLSNYSWELMRTICAARPRCGTALVNISSVLKKEGIDMRGKESEMSNWPFTSGGRGR